MLITSKRIANEYYAKPVAFSYWNSCSNGGRQGLIEAQRFPDDFDGIVANAPWVDQTGFMVGAMWNQKAITEAQVPATKLPLLAEKVMANASASISPLYSRMQRSSPSRVVQNDRFRQPEFFARGLPFLRCKIHCSGSSTTCTKWASSHSRSTRITGEPNSSR